MSPRASWNGDAELVALASWGWSKLKLREGVIDWGHGEVAKTSKGRRFGSGYRPKQWRDGLSRATMAQRQPFPTGYHRRRCDVGGP